ncbi:hypothetical protein BAUCODRAFT_548017 [Baudoinia panamericana UAMH 10762]|uniref:DUF1479 domain protein n=1 Tax=Baudoinia panamericana (strain UAMH 10762) TaxID=717646 RepID=M2N5W0_BAUPA|nr:uncharacterized protein BAUCODRAFT_548017 [Baudoinia panamericana UAMH 10762]EMC94424.1 hypothetical protein BAUCODRAFT_548017 [Baudoinia panamericana UAMH 10762]
MSQTQVLVQEQLKCPLLEDRFSVLKQSIIKPEKKVRVIESYKRLVKVLASEADGIHKAGPQVIPEIDFETIHQNGGNLPDSLVDVVHDRGCVIVRNVVPENEASAWEAELKDYTNRHRAVGGFPVDNPQTWSLFWTRPQVQIRSHPRVLEAMNSISKLWHVNDPTLPVDLTTQVAYPDRFRIRVPSKDSEYTLNAHVDSGSIERWECPKYRACYQAAFDGEWEKWDGWAADTRLEAETDLYHMGGNCSCWRSMQGWLSLSHTGTGEGTLRLLPSLKASISYLMLQPFFLNGANAFDDVTPQFPGGKPGFTQILPTKELHPDLHLEKSMIGIPPVKPGDYVFWHCDLLHEVDKFHPGKLDSSVVYNACTPLVPYNIDSLQSTRASFIEAGPARDFAGYAKSLGSFEAENQHEDHGARMENILSAEGRRAMGFEPFVVDEPGLTEGQRKVRQMANDVLGSSKPALSHS